MADPELENAYYYPGGVPITPQALKLGFEFPTYVSDYVWKHYCIAKDIPSRHGQSTDGRVFKIVQYCYEGLMKRLSVSDDFVYYLFKIWYFERGSNGKKQRRAQLGARLFIDPDVHKPWLYIFDVQRDKVNTLKKGDPPDGAVEQDRVSDGTSAEEGVQDGTGLDQGC